MKKELEDHPRDYKLMSYLGDSYFQQKKQEGSSKGAWGYQPGGISHTLTGSPETAEAIPGQEAGGGGCMRGKQPREREKYFIRLGGGTLVEVGREIYLEWYRSERRERYQRECDRKHGVCSINKLHEKDIILKNQVTLRIRHWKRF